MLCPPRTAMWGVLCLQLYHQRASGVARRQPLLTLLQLSKPNGIGQKPDSSREEAARCVQELARSNTSKGQQRLAMHVSSRKCPVKFDMISRNHLKLRTHVPSYTCMAQDGVSATPMLGILHQ